LNQNDILKLLCEGNGEYISGQVICSALGVSRTAVWKQINKLKDAGYEISSTTNRGYKLNNSPDIISRFEVQSKLKEEGLDYKVLVYNSVLSTNNIAKHLANEGLQGKTVILSNEQTKGRGRFNRSFYSKKSCGIYMSVILRPKLTPSKTNLITIVAAIAVCKAIESLYPIKPQIKWTNDILINGKKVCGILTELATEAESDLTQFVVLGIGINVNNNIEDFPQEIRDISTSLKMESGKNINRSRLIAKIILELDKLIENFYFLKNQAELIEQYKSYLCMLGENITIIRGETKINAKALDINKNAALVVQYDNGKIETINSGEISVKLN